jgi:lysophospholipase L1-like esterase
MQQDISQHAPLHMAVLGDSLAYGTGAGGPQHGFAYRLYQRLREGRAGSSYANYAVPGATLGDVTALQTRRLRTAHASLVLVVAGANNLLQTQNVAAFGSKYGRMLDAVRASAPHARIVAAGMPDVSQTLHVPEFAKAAAMALCASVNEEMRRSAAAHGAIFLDLFAMTNAPVNHGARYLSADGFHPSADGYAAIAKAAYPVLQAAL